MGHKNKWRAEVRTKAKIKKLEMSTMQTILAHKALDEVTTRTYQ